MAVDLATLSLSINNRQAIADAKATGQAMEEMGTKGETAARRIAASSNPVEAAIRKQAVDYASLTARMQDFARAGANAEQIAQMTGNSMAQAAAAVKMYSGTIARAEIDVGGLRAAQAQLALADMIPGIDRITDATRRMTLMQAEAIAMNQRMGQSAGQGRLAIGRLGSQFGSLVASLSGVHPALTNVLGVLGSFAAGTAIMGGVMLGLAAVAKAYDLITSSARETAKETKEALNSLREAIDLKAFGPGGAMVGDVQKATAEVNRLAAERFRLEQMLRTGPSAGGPDDVQAEERARARARSRLLVIAQEMQEARNLIAGGRSIVNERENEAIEQQAAERAAAAKRVADERAQAMAKVLQEAKALQIALTREAAAAQEKENEMITQAAAAWNDYQRAVDSALGVQAGREPRSFGATVSGEGINATMGGSERKLALVRYFDVAGEAALRLAEDLKSAKDRLGLGIQNWKRGNIGAGIEGGVTGAVADMANRFSPANLAAGAVTGLVEHGLRGIAGTLSDMFSSGKEAAEAFRKAARDFKLASDSFHALATGNSLESALLDSQARYESELDRIDARYPPGLGGLGLDSTDRMMADRDAAIRARTQDQALIEARIREQHERARIQTPQDFEVRLLAAQGQDKAAAALKLQHDQERERQALIDSFGSEIDAVEQTTLALLDRVQAEEKVKAAMDAVSGSMLNMVEGYKLQAVIFGAMNARSPGGPLGLPPVNPVGPNTGPGGLTPPGGWGSPAPAGDLTVNLVVDGAVVGRTVLRGFQRTAQQQYGDTALWSQIQ